MTGEDLTAYIARIETHLEAGQLDVARQLLSEAETLFGARSEFGQLRQRIGEVASLAAPSPAEDLIRRAQEEINRADYQHALGHLQQALQLRPQDLGLQNLLAQTEKAAARHSEAQERQRAVQHAAAEIGQLLEERQLSSARTRLQEAGIEFGRQNALINLQQRLDTLEVEATQQRIHELEKRVSTLFEAKNWRGVLHEVEILLRLAPDHSRGQELEKTARLEIERLESRRHHLSSIESTRQDIERLISAHELNRASQKLQEAMHSLGSDPAFEDLQKRIHRSRSDNQFRKRVEWAERRANEAERLIQEANRLSLQGSFEEAILRLETAQELDPSHPDIPDKLATSYSARDRQQQERQRFEAISARLQEIQTQLDALRLDQASVLIARTRQEFEAEDRLEPLVQRFEKLRAAERASDRLSQLTTGDVAAQETVSLLRDQKDVWNAYSWKQALLFPFRGQGPMVWLGLVVLLISLDTLAMLPTIGGFFRFLRWLTPVLVLGLAPALSRATVSGKNHIPALSEWVQPKRWATDAWHMFGVALLLLSPCLVWILGRGWHGQLSATSSPLGWWVVCLLLWPACALGVVALGAKATFGDAQMFRLRPHLRALFAMPSSAILISHGVFVTLLLIFLLRGAATSQFPWLAIPLQALIEVYALLALPHLVGSLMRRRGIDLAKLYT